MASRVITRIDAAASGLRRYFSEIPCKNGHVSERYVSNGMCVSCQDRFNQENMERNKTALREWILTNPDRKRLSDKNWCAKNKEKKSRTDRNWRLANKERVAGNKARWGRDWRLKNPEASRAKIRNRRALKRAAPGKHSAKDIARIFAAQKGRCAYCRTKLGKKFHVDHIIALANGGSNHPCNLQVTCPRCNDCKGTKDPITYAQSIGLLV